MTRVPDGSLVCGRAAVLGGQCDMLPYIEEVSLMPDLGLILQTQNTTACLGTGGCPRPQCRLV
jgi:hypothetical protein